MPPLPDVSELGDESMAVERSTLSADTGIVETPPRESARAKNQAADPVIKVPSKRPWYRRPRILYTIAIVVALISLGLAIFAILWATGVVELDTNSSAASTAGSTEENTQDSSTPAPDSLPATQPPVEENNPVPPPQGETTPEQTPPPTATPTIAQTTQTQPPIRTEPLQFYVMGDVPYADWEELMLGTQMGQMSANLARGAEFVVHVGDMQKAQRTNCALGHFYQVANILLQGPLPTFVEIGDNDYLDCANPTEAFQNYKTVFVDFENNWNHSLTVDRWKVEEPVPLEFDVTRQVENPEMFAFMEDGILFLGYTLLNMNLDQGELPDDLFYQRLADSKYWVAKQLSANKQNGIRGVVMFSHAMVSPDIRPFFVDLKTIFTDAGVYAPVLYIHGDGHDFKINTELGQNLGWPQLTRVEVDQGAYADPLLITVAPDLGGISQTLVADNSGLQFVVGNGMFLIDRQTGRYPDSVNPNN